MKRVFVAINLPEEIKEKLAEWQKARQNTGVRWTKKGSLHITLFFIGWVQEEKIKNISLQLKATADNYKPFDIYLTEITVGPDERNPRMIWANGPVIDELKNLQKEIANAVKNFANRVEDRPFRIHLTLARKNGRIKPFKEEIDLKFRVESFELMESKLLCDGAEYGVILSICLGAVPTSTATNT